MSDREKFTWIKFYLLSLVGPLVVVATAGLNPPGARTMTVAEFSLGVIGWIAGQTAAYLLVLSWRAAYLSGRSKR